MTRFWRRLGVGAAVAVSALLGAGSVVADAPPAHADQVRDLEYWLKDYGFIKAWSVTKGAGVKVAVIDTGIAGGVPDLKNAVVGGTDVSGIGSPDGQTPVGSGSEHATMVASLLAGRGTAPGDGILGVAPEASLLSVSVAFGDSDSEVSNDDQIAEGIRWAVDHGARVINMSLTRNTLAWPESWDNAFLYAFEHDVVVVAAAGNRGSGTTEVGAPATIPGVLTVAGVDRDKSASFDASSQGITISVAAPSEEMVGVTPDGGYLMWNGTSAAAPIVSGLVALVRSAHPDLSAADVIHRIIATADPNGHTVPSPIYGYGLINADAAVKATVSSSPTTTPAQQLRQWIHLHRRAEVEPTPAPTPVQAAVPTIQADPPIPRRTTASDWLPSPLSLTYISLPLAVLLGFAILVALLGIGATRHLKRIRRNQ